MKKETRKTATKLFVQITEILEDAHVVAIAGQSPHLQAKACARYARKLRNQAQEVSDIAQILILLSSQNRVGNRKKTRQIR